MPLIIDKLLRALLTIYVLSYYNKALDDNTYSDFIFDTFILSIVVVVCNLSYRPFVLLGNKPLKKDLTFIFFIYSLGTLILLVLNNKWWFSLFFLFLSKLSFYIEREKVRRYFAINYFSLILVAFLAQHFSEAFFLLIIPSIFPALTFLVKRNNDIWFNYKPKSLINFSTPLIINTILIVTYTKVDVFFIEYFINEPEFKSTYFNSVKLVDYVIMLPIVFVSYSFRDWSRGIVKIYNDYRLIIIVSLVVTALAISATSIAERVLAIDKISFTAYCLVLPFIVINTIRNQIFLLKDENWKITYYSILALLSNLVLSFCLFKLHNSYYDFLYATILTQILLVLLSLITIWNNKTLLMYKK